MYTRQGSTSGFQVGILNNSGGTATPTFTTDLLVGSTHLLVVKYDLSNNTASLFVNPVPGNSEPTATVTNSTGTTAAPTQIAGFVIRQGGTATIGSGNVEIDEIRVANTFASVTPTGPLSTNQNTKMGLIVYPNPVNNGLLNIQTTNNSVKDVVVYDLLGKKVLSTSTPNSVNVSSLKSGVYTMKITEEDNTGIMKIVIN
jgi:hypothetical protein